MTGKGIGKRRTADDAWSNFHLRAFVGLSVVLAVAFFAPKYVILGKPGEVISGALLPAVFYVIVRSSFEDLKEVEVQSALQAKIFNEQLKSLSAVFNYAGTALLAALTFSAIALFDKPEVAEYIIERVVVGSAACLWFNRLARQCVGFLKDERAEAYPSDSK